MYKVSISVLEGIKASLVKSNEVLRELAESDDSPSIRAAIAENEKQIELITTNFYIN